MSWPAMTWALAQQLKAPDKLVLLLLGYRTNPDTETADATIDNLARECGMSRSGVKVVIQRLVDGGLVEVIVRPRAGEKNLPNLYRLTFADRGHVVTPVGPRADPNRGHDVTAKAGSNSENGVIPRAKLDFSEWPSRPSEQSLDGWLEVRKRKRAPVTKTVMARMAEELAAAAAIGWTVDQVLDECAYKGWQGFRASWLDPKPGYAKPQPVRAGAGTAASHGRSDYAQHGGQGNGSGGGRASGGAIDRVLARARERAAQDAAIDGSVGPDRGDDDGSVRAPVDECPR